MLTAMIVLAGLLAAASVGVTAAFRELLISGAPEGLHSTNFRGERKAVVGGVVVVSTFVVVQAMLAVVAILRPIGLSTEAGPYSPLAIPYVFQSEHNLGIALLVLGFFAVGFFDDASRGSAGGAKGFRGHLGALRAGTATGGVIKGVVGGTLALYVGAIWELQLLPAVLDAVIIALSANLLNLLDLRPGRAGKVFFLIWLPLAAGLWTAPFFPVSTVVAASVAVWLPADLGERGMLGDGGANALGAVLGAGLALASPLPAKAAVVGILVALTLASEVWSFTSAISRISPLRWFDQLGRRSD